MGQKKLQNQNKMPLPPADNPYPIEGTLQQQADWLIALVIYLLNKERNATSE